jgi:hypothetical protein
MSEVTDKHIAAEIDVLRTLTNALPGDEKVLLKVLAQHCPDYTEAVRKLRAACEAVADHLVKTFPPYPEGKSPIGMCIAALEATKEFDKEQI